MLKSVLFFLLIAILGCAANAVDVKQVEKELNGKGAVGWIHGAIIDRGLYVFTYRNPNDFFDYIEMSLVTRDPALKAKLATLNRHDKVQITGEFLENPSPQKHIELKTLEVLKAFDSGYPVRPYEHEAKLPDDLVNLTEAHFLVHAVAGDGHILVLEYKDQILPAFIQNNKLTKDLYRGDIVELHFTIQGYPRKPTHLVVDESGASPIIVVDSLKALNKQTGAITGSLILFPKSPEIKFNVFAVQQNLQWGLKRQFTLVNFDDPEKFKKLREALQQAWDRHSTDYINGRNKLVNQKVTVKATGAFNVVSPSQANPQILLKDLNSIEILEK